MKKIREMDYLYATARLRALERDMLTQRDLEKMVDAASPQESYKIANDISLHSSLPFSEYETAINNMLLNAYALLSELTDNSPIFDIFRLKYDGHNLKVIIKSQALKADPVPAMSQLGILSKEEVIAGFNERKLSKLPEKMISAAFEASESLAKTGDPQTVDILLDKAVLESMLTLAQEIGFPFLTGIVQSYIDVENIRTAVRLKRMGKDIGLLKKLTVDGGKIALSRLFDAFAPEGFDAMKEMLFVTEYFNHFAPLFDGLDSKKPLTAFERGAENYTIKLLKSSRLVSFGLEPVISFILAKENEAKQIRIILASRLAGVERDKISERLRDTYA